MNKHLTQAGYSINLETGVWHKSGFTGIAYSDGDIIENGIANIIAKANDITVLSDELRESCVDWASTYHLSPTRANILRPFNSLLTGDVLEIGAGCGAITRYLGESGGTVLALEGSMRRAAIARSRTRDLGNVTVLSETFSEFETDLRFDVITLIGVLEYANRFVSGKNPTVALLERARSLLKPDGKLIIAIENQLGLKYFAGSPEDHLGQYMYGIEGRYGRNEAQTFGRQALSSMLGEAGFAASSFLAPFPDYKLPVSILTESGFNHTSFDAAAFAWQSVRRDPQVPIYSNFSSELTWPLLFENKVGHELSNSFLIVASPSESELVDPGILAFHYSTDRVSEYCKETLFSVSSSEEICVSYNFLGKPRLEDPKKGIIEFTYPHDTTYCVGELLSAKFIKIISSDNWMIKDVGEFLKQYISILKEFSGESSLVGGKYSVDTLLSGRFFDVIPQNIMMRIDSAPAIIDMEWALKEPIELGYLLFRSCLSVGGAITRFGSPSDGQDLTEMRFLEAAIAAAGLVCTQHDIERYMSLEARIQEQVTGRSFDHYLSYYRSRLAQPIRTRNSYSQIAYLDQRIVSLQETVANLEGQIAGFVTSRSWKITAPLRSAGVLARRTSVFQKLRRLYREIQLAGGPASVPLKVLKIYRCEGLGGVRSRISRALTIGSTNVVYNSQTFDRNDYAAWVREFDTITDDLRSELRDRMEAFTVRPLISVIMPTYNPDPAWLSAAINSVRQQIYPNWELCIADDASTDPAVRLLLKEFSEKDPRIKVLFREENGHISATSNSALPLANGEWIALLDHDDLLAEHAFFWVVDSVNSHPDVKLIYSDEDKINEAGQRSSPYFKCDWNEALFLSQNFISHLGVYRTDLIRCIGGFTLGMEGSQDYDLALRCIEIIQPNQIYHIPRVLYHWRAHEKSTAQSSAVKPYAALAGERALNAHLQRLGRDAKAISEPFGYRVCYALPTDRPLVTLIIPTKNGLQLIRQCVQSILEKTSYENYEILIIDNGSDDPSVLRYFEEIKSDSRLRIMRDDGPFNYSALNNAAVELARGAVIGLINNDIEVISPDWLSEMVSLALQPGVGAVGARLWYPNDTLQHGGVVLGMGGIAGHAHKNLPRKEYGYFARANVIQEFSALTAACLVVKKSVYKEVGGLNETDLKVAFNDVDFCLRVLEAGYKNIWTPYAELYHHESATRGPEDSPAKQARFSGESEYMRRRWGALLSRDPAYSPNLTLDHTDFSLAWPPRL